MNDNTKKDKQISYKELENAVREAIEEKDLSFLDISRDKVHIRYMQKFAETEISKRNAVISTPSLVISVIGVCLGIIAVGISFFLVGFSAGSVSRISYPIGGSIVVVLGILLLSEIIKYRSESSKTGEEIDFIQIIVLNLEKRLLQDDIK